MVTWSQWVAGCGLGMPSVQVVDILSGCAAGACSTIVGHPLDTLRVRMQTAPSASRVSVRALLAAMLRSEEGLARALYRGILPPLFTVAFRCVPAFYC